MCDDGFVTVGDRDSHVSRAVPDGGTDLAVRAAAERDRDAVRRVATRSMEASYGAFLSEREVRDAVEEWYGGDAFADLLGTPTAALLVATVDDDVVGFSQSHLVDSPLGTVGEIHWLHVDPAHRDEGVGAALLDRTRSALADRGADRIRGLVLADYDRGTEFYRAQGFERVGSRPVEVAGESHDEGVYEAAVPAEEAPPRVEATTADGETLYVDYADSEIGSEAPFFAVYETRDRERRYGWFCSNCETVDVAMDSMGRVVCNRCENRRKATRWDAVTTS